MLKRADGATLPGWRDFERIVAELLNGQAPESKAIFDVVAPCPDNPDTLIGVSVKSKKLSRKTALEDLAEDGRVYLELANSPAKFWDALAQAGIGQEDWDMDDKAKIIGDTIVQTIERWHSEGAVQTGLENSGKAVDLARSAHIVVSYSEKDGAARYQLHSFDLTFPKGIDWQFLRGKERTRCIRGFDPAANHDPLIDWYPFSGGQLKFYPRAASARYSSVPFELLPPPDTISVIDKAQQYWPDLWDQPYRDTE